MVDAIGRIAADKKVTPAQVALAWLLARKPWIVPIPGTTKLHRLEENIGAAAVELTAEDLRDIENAISAIPVQGRAIFAAAGGADRPLEMGATFPSNATRSGKTLQQVTAWLGAIRTGE